MKLTRRARPAIAGFAIAGVAAGGMIVAPQFALATNNTLTATTSLNVRIEPTTSSETLGTLSAGEQVARRGDPQGEWTPVTYNGKKAWVFSKYTKRDTADAASEGTATATEKLNIRAATTTLATILGTLEPGETVAVTGPETGGWLPVTYKGRDGFAYAPYLSLDSRKDAPDTSGVIPVSPDSDPTESPIPADDSSAAPVAPETSAAPEPSPTPEPKPTEAPTQDPADTHIGPAYASTAVNLRSEPNTSSRIITVLGVGEQVTTQGADQSGWTPVDYKGLQGWISTEFLAASAEGINGPATATGYTQTDVNVRTGPGLDWRIAKVFTANTEVQLTGVTQNGYSQIADDGTMLWISTLYLGSSPAPSGGGSGDNQGPVVTPNGGTDDDETLNTGGSSGLDGLTPNGKGIVRAIRQKFPQIATMYGVRPDSLPDHPSGRAVDIMMPNGTNDVALGNEISSWLQANANSLNIEYLIWRQHIWINGQGGWTAMADRGSPTANHMNHVHVTVNR